MHDSKVQPSNVCSKYRVWVWMVQIFIKPTGLLQGTIRIHFLERLSKKIGMLDLEVFKISKKIYRKWARRRKVISSLD